MVAGRATVGIRKALAKGRMKREEFMVGVPGELWSARCCGIPIDEIQYLPGGLTYWIEVTRPREMETDGMEVECRGEVVVGKARSRLRNGKSRIT